MDILPDMELLDHMVILFLIFWGSSILTTEIWTQVGIIWGWREPLTFPHRLILLGGLCLIKAPPYFHLLRICRTTLITGQSLCDYTRSNIVTWIQTQPRDLPATSLWPSYSLNQFPFQQNRVILALWLLWHLDELIKKGSWHTGTPCSVQGPCSIQLGGAPTGDR